MIVPIADKFSNGRIRMSTRNVTLTDHFDEFVDEQVTTGRFQDASEVLRAGLHLLERQTREDEEKLSLLRKLAAEGAEQLDQGQGIVLNGEQELAEFMNALGRRAASVSSPNAD